MVINVFAGNHFSRMRLFFGTNKFFNSDKLKRLITDKDSNYVVKIGYRSVKIVTSSNATETDFGKVKEYIETMFNNSSILIESTERLQWINDIKNVSIHILNHIE